MPKADLGGHNNHELTGSILILKSSDTAEEVGLCKLCLRIDQSIQAMYMLRKCQSR